MHLNKSAIVKLNSSETDLRIVQQSLINITKTFKTKLKVEPFISDPHGAEMWSAHK